MLINTTFYIFLFLYVSLSIDQATLLFPAYIYVLVCTTEKRKKGDQVGVPAARTGNVAAVNHD